MMKKVIISMFVMGLAGFLYAGDACCAADKKAEKPAKTEKKVCAEYSKVEGTGATCVVKKAETAPKTESAPKTEKAD